VLRRCNAILRETLSELRGAAHLMQCLRACESVAHLDKLAIVLVMLSIDSVRELAALASTTQREALDVLVIRLQDDLKGFQTMRSPSKWLPANPSSQRRCRAHTHRDARGRSASADAPRMPISG
jgi:hypothetical protein